MNKELKIKKLLSELDNARVGMALGKLNHIKKLMKKWKKQLILLLRII